MLTFVSDAENKLLCPVARPRRHVSGRLATAAADPSQICDAGANSVANLRRRRQIRRKFATDFQNRSQICDDGTKSVANLRRRRKIRRKFATVPTEPSHIGDTYAKRPSAATLPSQLLSSLKQRSERRIYNKLRLGAAQWKVERHAIHCVQTVCKKS